MTLDNSWCTGDSCIGVKAALPRAFHETGLREFLIEYNENRTDDDDNDDDDDILWIKTDGSSAALIDFKADRWQSQVGCH